jgi:spore coat polysaccharide biosynthesis predicted glycosyltransferase SpsG
MNSKQKTILFKVIGSPEMGMGHVYRCLSLSKILEKHYRVIFHINNNTQIKNLLQEHNVTYSLDEVIEELVTKEQIDLLLFDQLSSDNGLFKSLKSKHQSLKIIAIDYFDYDNIFVDIIINLFNQNLKKIKPEKDSVQYYEGMNYAIIRNEFDKYITQNREISPIVKNILVTFGGADHSKNTIKVIELLKTAKIHEFNIDVILGPLWVSNSLKDLPSNIHLHHSISNMADYMVKADLAFCGSGTTMMELLSIGTPTVVIPQNSLEERFALNAEKKGAIKVIKNDILQTKDVSCISDMLISTEKRKMLSKRGKLLIDGKGRERICNIVKRTLTMGD